MKLKTLKDLYEDEGSGFGWDNGETIYRELKAEAIKWVKSYPIRNVETQTEGNIREGVIEFIKYFFNLTEEDLK